MAIQKMTREEYEQLYGVPPSPIQSQPQGSTQVEQSSGKTNNFSTGFAKSALSTIKGLEQFGEGVSKFLTPKKYEKYLPKANMEQDFGGLFSEETLKTQPGEGLGRFVGDVAQYAIPQTKVSKLTTALPKAAQVATRAGVGAGIVGLQTQDKGAAATAAGVETALPVIGKFIAKPAAALMSRMFKGIGTGLSGMSSAELEAILKDPKSARAAVSAIQKAGGSKYLQGEANVIINGMKSVQGEASAAYRTALDKLEGVIIPTSDIKSSLIEALQKVKVNIGGKGGFSLADVDFADDAIAMKRGKEIINYLNDLKDLSGKGVRDAMDFVESKAFATTKSDARAAFNAFTRTVGQSLRDTVSKASPILEGANKQYSEAKQLNEAIQSIFGKTKFRSTKELLDTTNKIDKLFKQGEFGDDIVTQFLKKIGVNPNEFRAGEAARRAGIITEKANTMGTNPFEIFRSITAAAVPPTAVRRFAIWSGISRDIVQEMVDKLSPATRATLIKLLVGEPSPDENK